MVIAIARLSIISIGKFFALWHRSEDTICNVSNVYILLYQRCYFVIQLLLKWWLLLLLRLSESTHLVDCQSALRAAKFYLLSSMLPPVAFYCLFVAIGGRSTAHADCIHHILHVDCAIWPDRWQQMTKHSMRTTLLKLILDWALSCFFLLIQ